MPSTKVERTLERIADRLGKETDAALAREIGLKVEVVRQFRRRLGIAPARSPAERTAGKAAPAAAETRTETRADRKPAAVATRRVAVCACDPEDEAEAMARALELGGFWDAWESKVGKNTHPDDELPLVFIKPDLAAFDPAAVTGTKPSLVEHLIDALLARASARVVVGAHSDWTARHLANRGVLELADFLGYRWSTEGGHHYEIVDLAGDEHEGDLASPGGVLGKLPRAWETAAFRINFAKCKTHPAFGYALGLYNLLTVDADLGEFSGAVIDPADRVLEVLRSCPPDFTLIDAGTSSDGNTGAFRANPVPTRTLFAGTQPLAVDFVAAGKMLIDPAASRLNALALRYFEADGASAPIPTVVGGDLVPFTGFRAPHRALRQAWGELFAEPDYHSLLVASSMTQHHATFPFVDPAAAVINRWLLPVISQVDEAPWALAAALTTLATGARANTGLRTLRTLYDKPSLRRARVSLDVDPASFASEAFSTLPSWWAPFEALAEQTPPDAQGLHFRYLDEAVLFRYSRLLPFDFDTFVERVDVCRVISFMNDYLGGVRVPVRSDQRDRVVDQIERNVYLPQPNYLAIYGGKPIDVTKLGRAEYAQNHRKLVWRTIASQNQSAEHDDGSVTFTRDEQGTRVSIAARQKFQLPPFVETWQLDQNPTLKDALVRDAYADFFDRTMTNIELEFQGVDYRIGRSASAAPEPDALQRMARAVSELTRLAAKVRLPRARPTAPDWADERGYQHFTPPANRVATGREVPFADTTRAKNAVSGLRTVWRELSRAVLADWGLRG